MDDILTLEEIRAIYVPYLPIYSYSIRLAEAVAQAQHTKSYEAGKKETKRETLDWLDGRCDLSDSIRWSCQHCREALRREVA